MQRKPLGRGGCKVTQHAWRKEAGEPRTGGCAVSLGRADARQGRALHDDARPAKRGGKGLPLQERPDAHVPPLVELLPGE